MCVLDTPAQCICYSPDGTMLAIGLGGGVTSDTGEWFEHDQVRATEGAIADMTKCSNIALCESTAMKMLSCDSKRSHYEDALLPLFLRGNM